MAREAYEAVKPPLRIATRASELALRRARGFQAMLAEKGRESEIVATKTAGDRDFDGETTAASARRAFTHELDVALERGRADCALHALIDTPVETPPSLITAAVLRRGDPRDALVLNHLMEANSIGELPRGTRVGAASMRQRAYLLANHPELDIVRVRGDLRTRLRKVEEGQVHAMLVSADALAVLGITQSVAALLDPVEWIPTPGQGITVVQARRDDEETRELLVSLGEEASARACRAERAVLAALEGGPLSPVGAYLAPDNVLHAAIADPDGRALLRSSRPLDGDPQLAGVRIANDLRAQGASRILDSLRATQRLPAPQPDQ